MSILVIAEHDHKSLKPATLNTVTAAGEARSADHRCWSPGTNCGAVAQAAASKVDGRGRSPASRDDAAYQYFLAENMAALVAKLAPNYLACVRPGHHHGPQLFMPRAAGLIRDCAQISDIIGIESADTFLRPIYAGNAIATVQSKRTRSNSLPPCAPRCSMRRPPTGGNSPVKKIDGAGDSGLSKFVSQELSKLNGPN